ncbi:MAG: hypothetical protein WC549_01475 [Actinomycetota bacterium]
MDKIVILSIVREEKKYQIFQIILSERDGSIYITFPYYKHSKGLVSLTKFPKGGRNIENLSLIENGSKGKVTSYRVKVSHHISGYANFSLTGKIFNIIRKKSIKLDKFSGHLFTVQFQGLEDFKERIMNKKNRHYIDYDIGSGEIEAFKIVGFWYSPEEIKKRLKDISYEILKNNYNSVRYKSEDGSEGKMDYIVSNCERTKEYWLYIYCRGLKRIDYDSYSTLTFLGGFDPPEIANDLTQDTYFISMIYPAENYKELKTKLGSIDIFESE